VAFIYRYFPAVDARLDVRSPSAINSPRNAMALIRCLHEAFGEFHMAFQAVDVCVLYISTNAGVCLPILAG